MLQCGMFLAVKYYQKQNEEEEREVIVMMERKYVDRRKNRFDRRDFRATLFRILGRLARGTLREQRKEARRIIGERRKDWVRLTPGRSFYSPIWNV